MRTFGSDVLELGGTRHACLVHRYQIHQPVHQRASSLPSSALADLIVGPQALLLLRAFADPSLRLVAHLLACLDSNDDLEP